MQKKKNCQKNYSTRVTLCDSFFFIISQLLKFLNSPFFFLYNKTLCHLFYYKAKLKFGVSSYIGNGFLSSVN